MSESKRQGTELKPDRADWIRSEWKYGGRRSGGEEKDEAGMAYSARVVELLGLRRADDGMHCMEVGIAWEDRQAFFETKVDAGTYDAMMALRPLDGERVRLSPYPKWDPYRRTWYGAMVRMDGVSRDTLYFACSADFAGLLGRLREGELPAELRRVDRERPLGAGRSSAPASGPLLRGRTAAVEPEARTAEPEPQRRGSGQASAMPVAGRSPGAVQQPEATGARAARSVGRPSGRRRLAGSKLTARLLLAGGVLAGLTVPSAGAWWSNHAEAVGRQAPEAPAHAVASAIQELALGGSAADGGAQESAGAAMAMGGVPVEAAAVRMTDAGATDTEATEAEATGTEEAGDAAAAERAHRIDIGGGKEFFELPKVYVALTFDDGPSAMTKPIVDMLSEAGVSATFLFVGKNAERRPEDVAYARKHGMAVGNHSWDHSVLTKAKTAEQRSNMARTNDVLEAAGHAPVTVFRPPYGAVNETLLASAKAEGMKTLLWNRDPEDWNAKKPEDILRYFREVEAAGGVYVLHEDKNTVAALPDIIRLLQDKKLTFVSFE
ncbi:polysaccharide deacetylase family protein [Paenibacillus athensensis]|uniref:NodB homology domain-containing protein n=1 Tax=Paenibacillus athensensis TaxID=1967502 RepID=A0A4Y8Q9S4_9BACL|nr:polysaccharide deacetylase family protein [Paenibacillus athensensis]MCD1260155.1 polysaccharide deacetylase family protein [Paenibacillus athensensis]